MPEDKADEKKFWDEPDDVVDEPDEITDEIGDEEQLEYFRRGAEEMVGSTSRKRSRRGRHLNPRIPARGNDLPPDETTE